MFLPVTNGDYENAAFGKTKDGAETFLYTCKNANGLVFKTDDTRGLFEALKARGVTDFTQEPAEHFYGTDMGIRDPFGNHIRILQQGASASEATA